VPQLVNPSGDLHGIKKWKELKKFTMNILMQKNNAKIPPDLVYGKRYNSDGGVVEGLLNKDG